MNLGLRTFSFFIIVKDLWIDYKDSKDKFSIDIVKLVIIRYNHDIKNMDKRKENNADIQMNTDNTDIVFEFNPYY